MLALPRSLYQGSSPRMRGTHLFGFVGDNRPGIIPAYAGNTHCRKRSDGRARDHPRVCGEHMTSGCDVSIRIGIIPAYAGNTVWRHGWLGSDRDHPRVCGEHRTTIQRPSDTSGSSPRMRGTHESAVWHDRRRRIIPAYAGNTGWLPRLPDWRWDHPRVCGEHASRLLRLRSRRGSSPRMRGTPRSTRPQQTSGGIIPAYAGNTSSAMLNLSSSRDHPRVCGEHSLPRLSHWLMRGSSPRMRGTLVFVYQLRIVGRIIPAYAGNTRPARQRTSCAVDHPRVCGEHVLSVFPVAAAMGSSPRMRGTLLNAWQTRVCNRDHPRVCGEHLTND